MQVHVSSDSLATDECASSRKRQPGGTLAKGRESSTRKLKMSFSPPLRSEHRGGCVGVMPNVRSGSESVSYRFQGRADVAVAAAAAAGVIGTAGMVWAGDGCSVTTLLSASLIGPESMLGGVPRVRSAAGDGYVGCTGPGVVTLVNLLLSIPWCIHE